MRTPIALIATLVLVGCGGEDPSQTAPARKVGLSARAIRFSVEALDFLGVFPRYTCGDPAPEVLDGLLSQLRARAGCAHLEAQPAQAGEVISLSFPDDGCEVAGKKVSGSATYTFDTGDDRFDAAADLRGLSINGRGVQAQAGYSSCGDLTRTWVSATGQLAPEVSFLVDGALVDQGGGWFGETEYTLDGVGKLSGPWGTDALHVDSLAYKMGELLPHDGSLRLDLSSGHVVTAKFDPKGPVFAQAQVQVDDGEPLTLPVP